MPAAGTGTPLSLVAGMGPAADGVFRDSEGWTFVAHFSQYFVLLLSSIGVLYTTLLLALPLEKV